MKKLIIGVIVQARMGSTRLPGKVLMNLSENETVLDILIERLKLSKYLDEIIIATTPDKRNSPIKETAISHNVSYFIGSEENVLERYYQAAQKYQLDIVLRIPSDNPLIDPKLIDDMIVFFKNNNYDYIKNNYKTTNFPIGMHVEIFPFRVLKTVYEKAKKQLELEHVTYYIYTHPKSFSIYDFDYKDLKKFANLRLTLDEEVDLKMCRLLYEKLKKKGKSINFSIYDIIEIIEENPELMEINGHLLH